VSLLAESHTGGGYFELTRANEGFFFEFADWLNKVSEDAGLGLSPTIVDEFRVSYDDLVEAFGPPASDSDG
jgi:hypothetical protein